MHYDGLQQNLRCHCAVMQHWLHLTFLSMKSVSYIYLSAIVVSINSYSENVNASIIFETLSGELTIRKSDDLPGHFTMNFPQFDLVPFALGEWPENYHLSNFGQTVRKYRMINH